MATAAPTNGRAVNDGGDPSPPQVGLMMNVETPENVMLNYQLAGPSVRCVAFGIDFAVRMVILMMVAMFLGIVGATISPKASFGLFLVVLFGLEWGYYVICEGFFQGRTIGKRAMGLRVIQERGYPITFWSALLRNLLRGIDSFPFLVTGVGFGFYGVGLLSMLMTKRLQRVGDLIARTVVITDRSVVLPREPIILERIQPLPRTDMGGFVPGPRMLAKIEEFLGRRYVLTHERGHALASVLAGKLADRLDYRGDSKLVNEYPMAFLARVYVTFQNQADDDLIDDEEVVDVREPRSRRSRYDQQYAGSGGRR